MRIWAFTKETVSEKSDNFTKKIQKSLLEPKFFGASQGLLKSDIKKYQKV